jgi:hypothetical protein
MPAGAPCGNFVNICRVVSDRIATGGQHHEQTGRAMVPDGTASHFALSQEPCQ